MAYPVITRTILNAAPAPPLDEGFAEVRKRLIGEARELVALVDVESVFERSFHSVPDAVQRVLVAFLVKASRVSWRVKWRVTGWEVRKTGKVDLR
jgi:hypothetical protein